MPDTSFLHWPFFEDRHRKLQSELDAWAADNVAHIHGPDVDAACRELVKKLGAAGWLQHAVGDRIDTRSICLLRETLGRAGRRYVEKYHSYAAAQFIFGAVYRKLLDGEDVDLMNLFHPLRSEYSRSRPQVGHPLVENKLAQNYDNRC